MNDPNIEKNNDNTPLAGMRGLILDMDGVLWRADEPLGNLPEVFAGIEAAGCKVVLATNNAMRTVEQYLEKLAGFGVRLEPWQIITSAHATAHYLHQLYPEGATIHVVGEDGLRAALLEQGFRFADSGVVAVAAGMDRKFTYDMLSKAGLLIRAGALFVGTNQDKTYPTPQGLMPGAGSVLAFIEAASGVEPIYCGKPKPEMYRVALERMGTLPQETLVVGDRLETDIVGAQALGCKSALVLTGVSTIQDGKAWTPALDVIAEDLTAVVKLLPLRYRMI